MVKRPNPPNDSSSSSPDADECRELEELEQLARFLAERALLGESVDRESRPDRQGEDDLPRGNTSD